MSTLWQDLRYGARMLARNHSFTVVATLLMALGIGANTAVFSLIDAFLWQSLPVKEADRLVFVRASEPRGRTVQSFPCSTFEQISDMNEKCCQFSVFSFQLEQTEGNLKTEN